MAAFVAMIDVMACVIRAVEPLAEVVPDPVDFDARVEAPPPVPPRAPVLAAAGAVVSVGATAVVGASHGGAATVVTVVDGCVEAMVVVDSGPGVVEVVVAELSGGEGVIAESVGAVVVVVDAGVAAATVVDGHSSSAALAMAGTDDDAAFVEPVDRDDELAELALTTLELVCPSMRWRMVSVDDNCTVPSTLSVVVRSPVLTVAVLKIEGAALVTLAAGLRTARAAAAAPASATQTIAAITIRRLPRRFEEAISVAS